MRVNTSEYRQWIQKRNKKDLIRRTKLKEIKRYSRTRQIKYNSELKKESNYNAKTKKHEFHAPLNFSLINNAEETTTFFNRILSFITDNFNMIFTSNKNPALWREDFDEDATLLCALDRIFDDATVFKLRGESFRGKKLETISLQTGKVRAVEPIVTTEE